MAKLTLTFLSVALAVAASGPVEAAVRVVTTTTDLASLVESVGGDHVRVEALCPAERDPHHVEARPSYMVTVSRADLVVAVELELEVGWLPGLLAGARNPDVQPGRDGYLDASTLITPLHAYGSTDRSQGDIHPDGNPHYLLDPDNAVAVARGLAERLAQLDPDNAGDYRSNAEAFAETVSGLDEEWRARLSAHAGSPVVSYHQTFDYLLEHFGLEPIAYVEDRPGIPPSPSHLASLGREMSEQGVAVVLHESFYDDRVSARLAGGSGAAVLNLPVSVGGAPGADDYASLIEHLVSALEEGLR